MLIWHILKGLLQKAGIARKSAFMRSSDLLQWLFSKVIITANFHKIHASLSVVNGHKSYVNKIHEKMLYRHRRPKLTFRESEELII